MKKPDLESLKLAEFIGVLLGDGSIGIYQCDREKGASTQHKLQISCNSVDDSAYIYYLHNLFNRLFDITPYKTVRESKTCDLRCFNPELVKFLTTKVGLKLSPKWERAKIPERYLSEPLDKYVLRGYFDTDGSLVLTDNNGTLYPRLEMKVSPAPMQDQLIDIIERLGFNFGVYDIGKGKVRIQMNGKSQLSKWVKKIGFGNIKHIKKLERVIAGGGFEPPASGL